MKKLSPDSEEDLKGSWSNLGLTQSGWQVKERWYILSKKIKDHEEMTISALANKIGMLFGLHTDTMGVLVV